MNQERVFSVLLGPHVSEKTAIATEMNNQYTFRVAPDASKLEIRRAVEKLFKVKVATGTMIAMRTKRLIMVTHIAQPRRTAKTDAMG